MALYSSDTRLPEIDRSEELPYLNILSIDFDWIMAPAIQRYNKIIYEHDGEKGENWNKNPLRLMRNIKYNKEKFNLLYRLCSLVHLKRPEDLIVIDQHKDIVPQFQTAFQSQPFVIYNVDHHHDLGYNGTNNFDQDKNLVLNSGNWVSYLYQIYGDQFLYYVWIKNEESEHVNNLEGFIYPEWEETTNLPGFMDIPFDKVCLCLSPAWVPPKYYSLFAALQGLLENNINK